MVSKVGLAAIAFTIIVVAPIGLGYMLAFEDVENTGFSVVQSTNVTDSLMNGSINYYTEYSGYADNLYFVGAYGYPIIPSGTETSAYTGIKNVDIGDVMELSSVSSWTALDFGSSPYVLFEVHEGSLEFQFIDSANKVTTATFAAGEEFAYYQGFVAGEGKIKAYNISAINYRGTGELVVVTANFTNTYLDYAYGYSHGRVWSNGFENGEIVVTLSSGGTFTPVINGANGATVDIDNPTTGPITVNGQPLGNYDFVRVHLTPASTIVYGVVGTSWPVFNGNYPIVNAITINNPNVPNNATISEVSMSGYLRIDRTMRFSGTYPAMVDAAYSNSNMFPESLGYDLKFSVLERVGSSLTFGGVSFDVTKGNISVEGRTYAVNKSTFRSVYENNEWVNSVNGVQISTTADAAILTLGGTWSGVVNASQLESVTWTSTEWIPGEFSLSDHDFALVGLIVSVAAFVGFGLVGARSGGKLALLAIVCGCGAVFFMIIL